MPLIRSVQTALPPHFYDQETLISLLVEHWSGRFFNPQRIIDFQPFQITLEVMERAKPDAIFMHCLPAYRGEEMTEEVIEGPQSVVFDEAENRLHTEKAVVYLILA